MKHRHILPSKLRIRIMRWPGTGERFAIVYAEREALKNLLRNLAGTAVLEGLDISLDKYPAYRKSPERFSDATRAAHAQGASVVAGL